MRSAVSTVATLSFLLLANPFLQAQSGSPSARSSGQVVWVSADNAPPATTSAPPLLTQPAVVMSQDGGYQEDAPGGFPRVWARAEYLLWWFKDAGAPPLVTTGPPIVLPTLDRASTVVLFGNTLPGQDHSGGRFTVGFGLPVFDPCNECAKCGVELTYFFSGQGGNNFSASSSGVPILGRPFFDVSTGVPIAVVESVANPALGIAPLSGTVQVSNPSRMNGFEANGVCNLCCDPCNHSQLDLLFGFRYLALDEDLVITENLAFQDGTGETDFVRDSFSTRNKFYGGQIGLRGEKDFGDFFVRASGKIAIGLMHTEVNIDGFTTDTSPPGGPVTKQGGLLALSSNIGKHNGDTFAFVPEVEIDAGYTICSWMRAYIGYDFLYLSQVARPGDQIDLLVNTNLIPVFGGPAVTGGPARPAFTLNKTDFWAQGVKAGIEMRW